MIVVFIVVAVLVVAVGLFRLRRGGPGPAVNWFPRFLRPRINRSYEAHGWQQPYTDDGERNPNRDAL